MKSKTQFKQLLRLNFVEFQLLINKVILLLVFTFSAAIAFGQSCGDVNVNGSTNIIDALLVAQCYVGLTSCPPAEIGDVNCDGQVDIVDALLTAQLYVGLISTLDCCEPTQAPASEAKIIDHRCININRIPVNEIENAKNTLHIAYGYTSHGSQLTSGMAVLDEFMGGTGLYTYNDGGTGGALDLRRPLPGDVGYYPQWVNATRAYLGDPVPGTGVGQNEPDINVIIWSWCGQVSGMNEATMIERYLDPMSRLEVDYPGVTFVYMTGHLDGTGLEGNLHLRNEQIRQFCSENNKWLYDFADIETYDPDGTYFGDKIPDENCNYDSNNDNTRDANWAIEWQDSHTEGVDWYNCSAAHSQPLNGNLKAYAAWWTWAAIAGWSGGK